MNLSLPRILNPDRDAILCLDGHSTILLLNEAAARLFGCDAAHARGQSTSCFPILDEAVRQCNLSEIVAGGISKAVRCVEISRGENPSFAFEVVITSAIEDGQPVYTAVFRDLSAQKQLEVAGFESRTTRAIGSLAGGIAQHLNNAGAAGHSDAAPSKGKERILVVDDEELVRFVTKAVLAYRGYQITEAQDGEDAVKKYSLSPLSFDLVVMDLHMPRMNGREALHRIREINPKAKVILLSGGVHDPSEGVGQLDQTVFLHKPFDNEELLGLVQKVLDGE